MKRHIVLYLTLAAVLVLGVQLADALPTLLSHSHHNSLVRWGSTSGTSAHNHYSARSFRGFGDQGEPYSAFACWDNRSVRIDQNGSFSNGHCFINEWAGGTSPRYAFTGSWPTDARQRVRDAFNAWGGVNSNNPNLRTGIRFEETANTTNAEILVRWSSIANTSCGGFWDPNDRSLNFDSTPPGGAWDFGSGTGGVTNSEWHFYSVALHEVGHAVGLNHQNDFQADVMSPTVGEPGNFDCNSDGTTRVFFTGVDGDSQTAVRDLYSQPVASPMTVDVRCENLYSSYNECYAIPYGGSGGYTFSWTGGGTSDTWTGSCYGSSPYVTVTASNGAQVTTRGQCYSY